MSLLMFLQQPDSIVVVTDTLATTPEGDPLFFNSKCVAVPHLGIAVAHTGIAQVGYRWAAEMQERVLCTDIDMLDQYVPLSLQRIAKQLEVDHGSLASSTSVYHFGYSGHHQQYVRYIYRSENGFESEVHLDGGFGVKPHPMGEISTMNNLDDLIGFACQIRDEQDQRGADRVWIGGELVGCFLQDSQITYRKLHRFDDFEDDWHLMNFRLQALSEADASEPSG